MADTQDPSMKAVAGKGFFGAITTFASIIAENESDNAAAALQSREWQRTLRSEQAQVADAYARGGVAAGQLRMRVSSILGEQRLAYAAAGVDANSGTAAQTARSTGIWGSLDAETALNNARREALGHKTSIAQLEEQGQAAALARKNRDTERVVRAMGSILNIASVAG